MTNRDSTQSVGDGAEGRQPRDSPPEEQTGQAPRGTAGQAPDSGQGNGNRGNGDPPPAGAAPPDEQEQTAEEKLIAELAGDDGCVSQDERLAGATRIQNSGCLCRIMSGARCPSPPLRRRLPRVLGLDDFDDLFTIATV